MYSVPKRTMHYIDGQMEYFFYNPKTKEVLSIIFLRFMELIALIVVYSIAGAYIGAPMYT